MKTMLTMLLSSMLAAFADLFSPAGKREACWNGYDHTPHQNGHLGRTAEEDFDVQYLLAKKGTAAASIGICDATDEPIGPCMDRPATGDRATVLALGATKGTKTVIAAKSIAENARVYTTADGEVTDTAVNGCYLVGKSAEAGTEGNPMEIIPCFPVVQVVE